MAAPGTLTAPRVRALPPPRRSSVSRCTVVREEDRMVLRLLPDCVTLGPCYGLWMEGKIAAFARCEGMVGVRYQALILVSLVLSRFFRGSRPVPESPPLLRAGTCSRPLICPPSLPFGRT